MALFTVTFSHLHYNVFERGREAISGNFALFCPKLPHIPNQIDCNAFEKSYLNPCEKGHSSAIMRDSLGEGKRRQKINRKEDRLVTFCCTLAFIYECFSPNEKTF